MDNQILTDSYDLTHVIVEECMDVPASLLSVTEVFTCEVTGNTQCMAGLVDKSDMEEYMSKYPKDTRVEVRS